MTFKIYKYRNKINGKLYIGQTITSLKERAKYDGSGYSDSPKFWKAIQKYGWNSFEGTILQECSTLEDANYYEQYYIKKYNTMKNGYNLSSGGRANFSFSDETKQKISEISKKTYNHAKHDIPVYQFDIINNTIMQRYNSAAEAARAVNGNKGHITACCKERRKTHAGFLWAYSETCPKIEMKVYQYDAITKKLVKTWNKISDISEDIIYRNRVSNVCNHYQRTHDGYVWSYTKLSQEDLNMIVKENNSPNIILHNDKVYSSIKEASKIEKLSGGKILHMCIEKLDGWRMKNKMYYIRIDKDNMVNGPGIRTVLWTSGCNHACPKCHNPETWSPCAGQLFDEDAMKKILSELSHDYTTGLTITGGDPMYPASRDMIATICETCKETYPEKSIWCYTGYKYEDIADEKALDYIDVLVDGEFKYDLYSPNLNWRGSSNQRIIDVPETKKFNKIVLDKDNN